MGKGNMGGGKGNMGGYLLICTRSCLPVGMVWGRLQYVGSRAAAEREKRVSQREPG